MSAFDMLMDRPDLLSGLIGRGDPSQDAISASLGFPRREDYGPFSFDPVRPQMQSMEAAYPNRLVRGLTYLPETNPTVAPNGGMAFLLGAISGAGRGARASVAPKQQAIEQANAASVENAKEQNQFGMQSAIAARRQYTNDLLEARRRASEMTVVTPDLAQQVPALEPMIGKPVSNSLIPSLNLRSEKAAPVPLLEADLKRAKEWGMPTGEFEAEARANGGKLSAPMAALFHQTLELYKPSGLTMGYSKDDLQGMAANVYQGIKDGTIAPDPRTYDTNRLGLRAMVANMAAKEGFPYAQRELWWTTTRQKAATLGGPMVSRWNVSLTKANQSLQQVLDNADAVDAAYPLTRYKDLNYAMLTAASHGLPLSPGGPKPTQEQINAATNLLQSASAMKFELAQALSTGAAPTDKSMAEAGHLLDANWSRSQLRSAVQNIRQTLGYASNSLNNLGGQTPFGAITPPAPGVSTPATGRMRVRGPNGESGTLPEGPLPPGWSRVQ